MAQRAREDGCPSGGEGERQRLAFIDHDRQDYAERVPVPCGGEFLIGDYRDEDGGVLVGELGELKIQLHNLGDRHGTLEPQLCVFGDGAGALSVLRDRASGDLTRLLRPVRSHEEFSRRLLGFGLRDASHTPLDGGR